MHNNRLPVLQLLGFICFSQCVLAQGTLADYERAATFQHAERLVTGVSLIPHWIEHGARFWYVSHDGSGKTYVMVDPQRGRKQPVFDHTRLAAALSQATGKAYSASGLPFDDFEYRGERKEIAFTLNGSGWKCAIERYECIATSGGDGARVGEALSPDRHWAVFLRDHNLWVRNTQDDSVRALTLDGTADFEYGTQDGASTSLVTQEMLGVPFTPKVYFSPDSSKLISYRIDARDVKQLHLIETVTGSRPRLRTYRYPMAGDQSAASVQMVLCDLQSGRSRPLDGAVFTRLNEFEIPVSWDETGRHVAFIAEERGFKSVRLQVVDVRTGLVQTLLKESSATYIDRNVQTRLLRDGATALWLSEQSGWNQLYLSRRGSMMPITRGEWVVREIIHVDEKQAEIYFVANGREAAEDPYYRHLYRVKFDGSRLQNLTPEPADHDINFSPAGHCFTDTYSRIDTVPVSVLRTVDGRVALRLQNADVSKLAAAGWRPPTPFKVKAHDGSVDLYGVIFRPSNFDPSRSYPVLDAIYGGPQVIRTPKALSEVTRWRNEQALAELGFVVITLDGRGTALRSRAFREISYHNLGNDAGLEDHIDAVKQLAARYPYLDIARVGIYGHSGGGYAAVRALLRFPEFYRVAVASSGDYEKRSYWAEWGERFEGFPVDQKEYAAQADAPLAANLQGKLLLAYGTLDDNVHPDNTLQLVDALIAANKDFDLLVLPNRNHGFRKLGSGESPGQEMDPYFLRRRWDYFVEHLLKVTPPREFRLRAGRELPVDP